MHWAHLFLYTSVLATLNLHHLHPELSGRQIDPRQYASAQARSLGEKRQAQSLFLTDQTKKFVVNGSALPEVDFDIGESYAGLLPLSGNDTSNQLFFWFFPSTNPAAQESKEILIWLTGGPGCSSIGEMTQSNGPWLWQPGVLKPFANKFSWHHLTNVVWIDQPVGAGFSQGTPTARDELDVAEQFLGFWKNFIDTFAMQGYKVYVTGSSYSGMYVPYISSAMLDRNNTAYYNVSGAMVFDGLYSNEALHTDIPIVPFVARYKDIFAFNDTFTSTIQDVASKCGYTDYLRKYLVFPPTSPQPSVLPGQSSPTTLPECSLFLQVYLAALELNPCFSPYTITDRCPLPFDPLGFATGTMYSPPGSGPVYFDRDDVKAAINAVPLPTSSNKTWRFCTDSPPVFLNNTDLSPSSQAPLSRVIERTGNVILGHGALDFVLVPEGTLLTIQNMSWKGQLGFRERPSRPLYVPPYHGSDNGEGEEDFAAALAGSGVVGTTHSERGLTWFGVATAGHFLTANQPGVAYRAVEVLLGRVDGFGIGGTGTGVQDGEDMGNGTMPVGFGGVGGLGECLVEGGGGGGLGGGGGPFDGVVSVAAKGMMGDLGGGGSVMMALWTLGVGMWLLR